MSNPATRCKVQGVSHASLTSCTLPLTAARGYTLVELIIAVGIFALVMMLAAGSYLIMISLHRETQAKITGINNLSYALDTLTREIRTGINYNCGGAGNCPGGASTLTFTNEQGATVSYSLANGAVAKTSGGVTTPLTDPSVQVSALTFYASGTSRAPSDYLQSRVTIVISGTVSSGPGKTVPFTVETGASMRGSDI